MRVFALIYIVFVIGILWFEKILYKDSYENQYHLVRRMGKLNDKVLKNNLNIIQQDYEILKENSKLREENKKLKKSKNRVAKVIKEEKINDKKRDISKD